MNIKSLIPISLFLILIACKAIDKFTQFNMTYNETVVIPSSTGINLPTNIDSPEIESNSEATFSANDTRKDKIEDVKLTAMDLTLTSPANGDFSFLKSVEIFIYAEGLEETKIAWKYDISDDAGNTLDLETSDTNLEEYIKKESFKLRLTTVTDKIITSEHKINVHSIFFVDAKVLGI